MTDFNILRKRYSEVLCGRGHSGKRTADCILRSDERTEQRLAQLDTRIEKAITSNEPGIVNATLKGILDISTSFSQNNSRFYHDENIKNKIAATRSKSKYAASNIASITSGICGL